MNKDEELIKGKKFRSAIRKAGALILSERFRTRGAPRNRLEQIFKEKGIPPSLGIRKTRKELNKVGVKLKKIDEEWRGQKITRYLGLIDPKIKIEDIRPYNRKITAILALCAAKGKRIPFSEAVEEIEKIVKDKENANDLLSSAIKKLEDDDVLGYDKEKGIIELTDYGEAILPSKNQIKKIIIDTLVSGKGSHDD